VNNYLVPLTESFRENANPENAFWMKKYMKERFEFLGIKKTERAPLQMQFFTKYGLPSSSELPVISKNLFELEHREFQYFALDLLERSGKLWDINIIYVVEELIATKSWWDTVDMLAGKLAGRFFQNFSDEIPAFIESWNNSDNIWLVRSSILFQLHYKARTNHELLFKCILPHTGSNEFFIQKAIGWALRQYARYDSGAVLEFVKSSNLKPLSKREALKHIG